MMRKKPIGGLFSKLVLPRKEWALCSPQDSRSSEPPRFSSGVKNAWSTGSQVLRRSDTWQVFVRSCAAQSSSSGQRLLQRGVWSQER